jgi:23S rRNA pseudouridine1911/1915/1917 synthase
MAHADPLNPPFRILFEDQHLIVLSKAPGLLSQGDSSGEASLVDLLRAHFGRNYVGLIHRLDRNTSGLMVVAKRSKSAERLTAQLQAGELVREYHALLHGMLPGQGIHDETRTQSQKWEHWLLKSAENNEVRTVPRGTPGAKPAVLFVEPLRMLQAPGGGDLLTLARFKLDTGRSHQIRAQARAMGHPLIGDSKYGNAKSLVLFPRPALHSCRLSFLHPISKERLDFEERYAFDMIRIFPSLLE